MNSRTISSKSVYGRGNPAMPALKLMAFENEYHRNIDALSREIKRLRGEVGTMTKRYNSAKREVRELMVKVKQQPAPEIPAREKEVVAEDSEKEGEENRMEVDKKEEEKTGQLRTSSPTPPPDSSIAIIDGIRYEIPPEMQGITLALPSQLVKPAVNKPKTILAIPTVQANTTVAAQPRKITSETRCNRVTNDAELWQEWRNAGPKSKKKSRFIKRGKCTRTEGRDVSWGEWEDKLMGNEKIWLIGPEKKEGQKEYVNVFISCISIGRGKCLKAGRCGWGQNDCEWGEKWITRRLVWVGGEMTIRGQNREEAEEEEEEKEQFYEEDEMEYDGYGSD